MDVGLVLAALAMGAAVGFAAGLLGIGGGLLVVPFLTFLFALRGVPKDLVVHMAIATSLATILSTSVSSVLAHHRRGAVRWRIVRALTPGILIGSWIGPGIGKQLNAGVLALLFAAFAATSATRMLLHGKPSAPRELPGPPGMFAAGGTIGTFAGLVGVGGAFVSVPFMTWCNVKIHEAVATSAALGFPIALAGTVSNVYYGMNTPGLPPGSLGFVHVPAMLLVSISSVLTAPLGARTAHRLPVESLRRVFAIALMVLAGAMLYKAWR